MRALAAHVDVEAVLQEALLRVWQVAPRFAADGRPNGLLRLGVRIARNLALDELRRARLLPEEAHALERALADAQVGDPANDPDPLLRQAIEDCRGELPGKPAAALAQRLAAAGGEPDAVLAERLGMRLNTFLQNVTRARKLLAECLERRGVDLTEVLP
ncbi:MAG TPA: sigma-70 family RNA polymerase sigma factor [Polyangia bacterium]|nr:sigma-70 family RNA polymerase sigma factor [Polyangia bacterium]